MELSEQKIHNLDSAISDLEASSSAIKGYSKIFRELSTLQSSVNEDRLALEANSKSLAKISDSIDEQFTDYKDITIQLITDASVELGDKLEKIVIHATNEINQASSHLQSVSSAIDEQTSQIKSLFREIDSSLVIRLDKHKSDISVDIRNEGSQIQRALESSVQATVNNLETVLLKEFESQKKTIKFQIIIIIVLTLITISSVAVQYFF